jgi:hypothetical protein
MALTIVSALLLGLSNCGKNPFGSGFNQGLRFFVLFGKAMQKPEEQKNKQDAQAMAGAAAKRLAKGLSIDSKTPLPITYDGDTAIYKELLYDEPHANNPYKRSSGTAAVRFKFGPANASIADVYSWEFSGYEVKTWAAETCTVYVTVRFEPLPPGASIADAKPGLTYFYAKNITPSHKGFGDYGSFDLGYVEPNTFTQRGEGTFFDAKAEDEDGKSRTFTFYVSLDHQGTFLDYSDNTGNMYFTLDRPSQGDQLYFNLDFTKEDSCYGHIYQDDASGRLVAMFVRDQAGKGYYTIYDSNGKAISTETY